MSLVAASRLVDMVFVATPEEDRSIVNKVKLFSKLRAVIWIPRDDLDAYINKADAVLIGPGMMRFHRESDKRPENGDELDLAGTETKMMTKYLLAKHPEKKWVIDGGSLQTMEASWIPKNAILTPNRKEFEILFGEKFSIPTLESKAREHSCVIVYKAPISYASDGVTTYEIEGGNSGLTKGGTGDVLAGVAVGLLTKNDALLAAAAATLLVKKTGEKLAERVGIHFNADDLAEGVFVTRKELEVV
jgi:NAD(P)H-hydrate epimerase